MAIHFAGRFNPGPSSSSSSSAAVARKKYLDVWLNDHEKELLANQDDLITSDGDQDFFLHTNKGPIMVAMIPKETGHDNALHKRDLKHALRECAQSISEEDQSKKLMKGYAYIDIFKDEGYNGTPQVVSRLKRNPFWNGASSPEVVNCVPALTRKEEKEGIKLMLHEWQDRLNAMRDKDMPNTFSNALFGIDCFIKRPI